MKKKVCVTLVFVLLLSLLLGSTSVMAKEAPKYKIAFLTRQTQFDFNVYMIGAAGKRAEELGIQMDLFNGNGEFSKVADYLDQCVELDYDLIITNGDDALIPSVLDANAKGVPIINYDAKMDTGEFVARVASDNEGMGRTLGEYAVEVLTERNGSPKGTVIALNFPTSAPMEARTKGFRDVLSEYPDIVIVEEVPEARDAEPAQRHMDDVLIRMPKGEIDLIFTANSGFCIGTLASVLSAGRNEIAVIGTDNDEGQLLALQDPNNPYLMSTAQNNMLIGTICIDAAYEYLENGTVPGDIMVEHIPITKDTIDEYIASVTAEKESLKPYLP